ncbi:hypothetical protein GNF10_30945 [Nostoc sp. UCD121]|uniref:DUF6174 domain-containing protein n=1 Tax=unclassified Nostoc TaxID=2593658 RepID=UPI00162A1F4C|nr:MULTISPECIES: DUF6174 domain-containing protein [unclassified Nostoc]MBC1218674.1 hypothetical protein [Nostoc sp. UCD120]MBC1280247.1 hypothetical protein [Nostoc sp. UCD121]MBC1295133.1 hypothetical protein [Nostoc sp. UCD122]
MRLPIIISAGLLLSFGLNLPVMSQSPIEIAQSPTKNNNLDLRRLKFNRYLWNQQNISNYRYTFSNGCFCIPDARGPVVIEVRNGQTTSITSVATGQAVNPEFFQNYKTIPKLFDVIQDAINRQAYSLNVSYSPKLGYPTKIEIDYNSQIADEEIYLTIENFQEIK